MPTPLPKRDESVRIPPAVRAAAARSNALIEAKLPAPEQGTEEDGNPEAGQAQEATQPAQDGQPPLQATPPAAEQAKPPQADPDKPRQRTAEEWEHAFHSVNERYRISARENEEFRRQIQELTQRVEQLSARPPELQAQRLLTPEEENEWGKELLTVVGKKAREELAPIIDEFKNEISNIKGQVQTTHQKTEMTARDQMFGAMDREMPQWRAINTDPDFLRWLALPDGLNDVIRSELLDEAVGRNDAAKVLRIFRGFLNEKAATEPKPTPAPARKQQDDPLMKLAAPGRARTAAAHDAPAEKPFYTTQQISEFFAEVARGRYRGREDEKNRIEADIFAAQREGRVRAT